MKKLFYVFAVAFMGLAVACGNANNSSTADFSINCDLAFLDQMQ